MLLWHSNKSQTLIKPRELVTLLNLMPKLEHACMHAFVWVNMRALRSRWSNISFLLDTSVYFLPLPAVEEVVCLRRSGSFLALFLQSVSRGPSPERPTELVNAMITSNSGRDLRRPVDTYAFKCEARLLIGGGADGVLLRCLCIYPKLGWGFTFEAFRVITPLSWLSSHYCQRHKWFVGLIRFFLYVMYCRQHSEMIFV